MDIEVAEQLFPNVLTIVTQLCATGVLLYFAVKYLWTPAREMLTKRQDLMQSKIDDAERIREAASEEKATVDAELRDLQARAKGMVENAKSEANSERERILEEANRQAEATLEHANAAIEKQRAELRRDIQQEIVDVALAASTMLMGKETLEEQDQRAIESFVREIQDESGR
ncbi:MAG: F0F1 ATP synthase subunit B [Atopobiaceae bacterium]|nr:F0F1 ATP synthase subunit B [Atopobiaceae bacterium]MBQ6651309.1 F0F1 ATP synthase subunit B [Atopobiaceae bacterium]MBR3384102.1 F0F1 ATP synthase subunit B [Atopobiaceae bacterium]